MDKITKSFPVEVVKVDREQGIVDAIVAVMGNIDLGDDIIHLGAFTKTLSERASKIKVLDNHKTDSTTDVIGKPVSIREIGIDKLPDNIKAKYPDANGGLYTVTQFDMDDEHAKKIFNKLANGYIDEWSIGFSIPRGKSDRSTIKDILDNTKERVVRNIREVILYEYSPVIFGMNDATSTLGVKRSEKQQSLMQTYWSIVDAFESIYLNRDDYSGFVVNDIYDDGTMICRAINIDSNFNYYLLRYRQDEEDNYIFDEMDNWLGGNYTFVSGVKSEDEIEETKAGRVLSQSNFDKISKAHTLLMEVVESAKRDDDDMQDEMMNDDSVDETKNEDDIIEDNSNTETTNDQADPVNNQSLTKSQEEYVKEIDNLIKNLGV